MNVPAGEVAATSDTWLVDLYAREYRSLVRLAFLLLGDRELSEEVVQDAFVSVHLARGRIRDDAHALPYLRSAVLNGARSQVRKRDVRRRAYLRPVDDTAAAEVSALAREESRRMVELVRTLPARQRDCLLLRYYLDLSEADIAETLGVSAGSVKTHVHRGMAALAERLEATR